LNFPSHIRRIIICFIYSKEHGPGIAYSFFKQVDLPPSHVIDVKDIHPLRTPEEDEVHIHIFNQSEPYDSLPSADFKADLLPATIPSNVNNQLVEIQHAPNYYFLLQIIKLIQFRLPAPLTFTNNLLVFNNPLNSSLRLGKICLDL
jgi:hypothetical protein